MIFPSKKNKWWGVETPHHIPERDTECIVCGDLLYIAGEFQTCVKCLENVLKYQHDLLKNIREQLHELFSAHDVMDAQTKQLLEIIKANSTREEYNLVLQHIVHNPYDLGEKDIC